MFKSKHSVRRFVVGIYPTLKAASKQVDMLMRSSGICANIVQHGTKYEVQAVRFSR